MTEFSMCRLFTTPSKIAGMMLAQGNFIPNAFLCFLFFEKSAYFKEQSKNN
jgi:hypothetical protein